MLTFRNRWLDTDTAAEQFVCHEEGGAGGPDSGYTGFGGYGGISGDPSYVGYSDEEAALAAALWGPDAAAAGSEGGMFGGLFGPNDFSAVNAWAGLAPGLYGYDDYADPNNPYNALAMTTYPVFGTPTTTGVLNPITDMPPPPTVSPTISDMTGYPGPYSDQGSPTGEGRGGFGTPTSASPDTDPGQRGGLAPTTGERGDPVTGGRGASPGDDEGPTDQGPTDQGPGDEGPTGTGTGTGTGGPDGSGGDPLARPGFWDRFYEAPGTVFVPGQGWQGRGNTPPIAGAEARFPEMFANRVYTDPLGLNRNAYGAAQSDDPWATWYGPQGGLNPMAAFVASGARNRGLSGEEVAQTLSDIGTSPREVYETFANRGWVEQPNYSIGGGDLGTIPGGGGAAPTFDIAVPEVQRRMMMGALAEGPWSGRG